MINKNQLRQGATSEVVSAEDVVLTTDDSLVVHLIDRDSHSLAVHAPIIRSLGYRVEAYTELDDLPVIPSAIEVILLCQRRADDFSVLLDHLSDQSPSHPLIVASVNPQPQQVVEAVRKGALDYLRLPLEPDHLETSLRRVMDLAVLHVGARLRVHDARQRIARLSPRERAVLEGVANGKSNKVIARELGISPRTVEIHRANMMDKLDVSHAGQVIRMALTAGIGEPEQASEAKSIFPWGKARGEDRPAPRTLED